MGYQYLADDKGSPRQDGIQRTGDPGTSIPSWVPNDPNSPDWQAYQTWLAAGNTPAAAVWSPPVPDVPGDAIVGVLSKAQAAQCDVRDLARIAWRDDVPVTNNKLKRIADAIGSSPDALRAAAGG